MTIGEKLRKLRGNRPREEIAKEVGVSVSALAMYELDERIPRDEIKVRLANKYNVGVQELFLNKNVTISDTKR